jgi:hypothetical protein
LLNSRIIVEVDIGEKQGGLKRLVIEEVAKIRTSN